MKYLRKFFENNDNSLDELQKFCNENLAYLIDEGFEVKVEKYSSWLCKKGFKIKFSKVERDFPNLIDVEKDSSFFWRNIKNDFIPFFELLNEIYEICPTNRDYMQTYHLNNDADNLIIEFETPRYIYEHLHFFYNKEKILSGVGITSKKIFIYVTIK